MIGNKKVSSIAIVLILLAAVIYSQRAGISLKMLPGLIETSFSNSPLDDFEDGLHVALCGAGGPMPDPVRSGPCVAVVAGDKLFVVDAGSGSPRNLTSMRYPTTEIEALFLTHFHSDHIDGLGEMALMRWVSGDNQAPLPVHGPEGVSVVVAGFNQAYNQDAAYRNEHHGDSIALLQSTGMQAVPTPAPAPGESVTVYADSDLTVEMFAVDHSPVSPAVGYLFRYKDRSALISGDTAKSDNLQAFAKDVDLLVHEALAPNLVGAMRSGTDGAGDAGLTKILEDILDYHATPREAAEVARDASVGHLLYYHIVPPLVLPGSEAAFLEGVDDVFSSYTVGVDGHIVSMPANSDRIEVSKLRL